jgi:class 3 adenylate cyclase/predicted ATPase
MATVREWLEGLGLGKFADAFESEDVSMRHVPELSEADLRDLGLPMGPRKEVLRAAKSLDPSVLDAAPEPARRDAERRQITVMFCDLVGSTSLSEMLDPEDLRAIMHGYQAAAGAVIERYDGHVAQYLGDGLMTYFGWPTAHEDDAARAVRAGLDIVAAVKDVALPASVGDVLDTLHVRIGIATGPVVVGETGGGDASLPKHAIGETPNLAARMQGVASADEIVVAPSTRRLLGGEFEVEDLGDHALKGVAEPLRLWRVNGLGKIQDRFEAASAGHLTPFVGREEEIELLMRRWESAKRGEGKVVLLSGEPGIGKSRISEEVRNLVGDEDHIRMRFQCSPFNTNSSFFAFSSQFERGAGIEVQDSPDVKLDKLDVFLRRAGNLMENAVPLFAQMLGIPTGDRFPALGYSPMRQKSETIKALGEQMSGLAAQRPVLILMEDIHWIDPTSLEALDYLIPLIENSRVLFVISFRPEFHPPWTGAAHVSLLALNRLAQRTAESMVARVTGGKALPDTILRQIIAKTDGVPLFVEELTKTVVESDIVEAGDNAYVLAGPVLDLAIPSTLRDSLMARLDRLPEVREVAQTASCIGREFTFELLAEVSTSDERDLEASLQQLVDSELVLRKGAGRDAHYTFKHALVQDTAYDSLLTETQRRLHGRIADVLAARSSEATNAGSEVLARHLSAAGRTEEAIDQLAAAGTTSVRKAANKEAIAHFTRALDLLATLPDTIEHKRKELQLRATVGPAILASIGWSSAEAAANYERARALCDEVGDAPERFSVLWGIWVYNMTSKGSRVSLDVLDQMAQVKTGPDDVERTMQTHHASWTAYIWHGQHAVGQQHARDGLALYDFDKHRLQALRYGGHDPGVCGYGQSALSMWITGLPEQSRDHIDKSLVLADKLDHPPSYVHAHLWACFIYRGAREIALVERHADIITDIATQQALGLYAAFADMMGGWAMAARGQIENGRARAKRGFTAYSRGGTAMGPAYFHSLIAEVEHLAGNTDEALRVLANAHQLSAGTGDVFWDPEVYRLQGSLTLAMDASQTATAERAFQDALATARDQSAHALELRAATSLATLQRDRGHAKDAMDCLSPAYDWFTEGFETADLKTARALLDDLAAAT